MDYQTLNKLFQDRDKNVRLFCLKSLLKQSIPNTENFILEGLKDGRPEVVSIALKVSAKTFDPEITAMVLSYLSSPNAMLKVEALYALKNKNANQVKKAVCDFLKCEEDTSLVATGIQIIGSFKSIEFIPLLKAFLTYSNDRVRANAVEALGELDSDEIIDILKTLVSDRNNRVRANAIKALWSKGIRFGLNTLPEELRSPNSRKRSSVAYILGEINEERSLDLLIGLLSDISPTVRNRAVISIGKIGSARVIGHLINAYAREDEKTTRDTIIKTAMNINAELAVARLTERYSKEENSRLRANMINSLGLTYNSKAVVLFSQALKDDDGRVRANAVEAIGFLNDADLAELLFPLLNDSHNRVRSNTAAALWKLGGMGSILTLKQMLRSSHKQMRASAAWALGEIGALQFSDVLQDLTNDTDPDVRRCALKALAKVSKIT